MTSKVQQAINWAPTNEWDIVVETADYIVYWTGELIFDTPIKGVKGYALVYKPSRTRQAEGVDIVAAVAQCYAAQRVLDRVKAQPSLLTDDPEAQVLGAFFGEPEGKSVN
jgi:hypothetical protein